MPTVLTLYVQPTECQRINALYSRSPVPTLRDLFQFQQQNTGMVRTASSNCISFPMLNWTTRLSNIHFICWPPSYVNQPKTLFSIEGYHNRHDCEENNYTKRREYKKVCRRGKRKVSRDII